MNIPTKLEAEVFVYRLRNGQVVCRYAEGPHPDDAQHLATLEPRRWIEMHWDELFGHPEEK